MMVGWGTFIIEHLMYGVVLGLLAEVARTKSAVLPATASAH